MKTTFTFWAAALWLLCHPLTNLYAQYVGYAGTGLVNLTSYGSIGHSDLLPYAYGTAMVRVNGEVYFDNGGGDGQTATAGAQVNAVLYWAVNGMVANINADGTGGSGWTAVAGSGFVQSGNNDRFNFDITGVTPGTDLMFYIRFEQSSNTANRYYLFSGTTAPHTTVPSAQSQMFKIRFNQATPYNTQRVDGLLNEWNGTTQAVSRTTGNASRTLDISWDAEYIYFLVNSGFTASSNDRVLFGFDRNPGSGGNANGSTVTFNGATFPENYRPDIIFRARGTGSNSWENDRGTANGSNGWAYSGNIGNTSGSDMYSVAATNTSNLEVRIKRTAIGSFTQLGVYVWLGNSSDAVYDSYPHGNPTTSALLPIHINLTGLDNGQALSTVAGFSAQYEQTSFTLFGITQYRDLRISNPSGSVTGHASAFSVRNLTIDANANLTLNGTLGADISVAGDVQNGGTFDPNSRATNLTGSADQTLSGTLSFPYLTINKTAGKVILNNDVTVSNTLAFTSNHNIETGSNTLSVTNDASGAVDYSGGGRVVGDLARKIANTSDYYYPMSQGGTNSLVQITILGGTFGANPMITVTATDGKHPLNNATTNYLTCYWTIEASDISTIGYDINFVYADADFTGSDETQIKLWKTVSGVWTEQTTVVTPATNTLSVFALTSFSEFTGAPAGAGSFPVEWQSFTATPVGSVVQLDWATASEQNADRFMIERSADGTAFAAIGEQMAAGNSATTQQYQFTDGSPLAGTSYYRLRQLDMDGTAHFSNTVEVAFAPGQTALSLVPNPVAAGQQVTLLGGQGGKTTLSLYTLAGQQVMEIYLGNGVYTASLPVLPAGLYLYRLSESGNLAYGRLQVR